MMDFLPLRQRMTVLPIGGVVSPRKFVVQVAPHCVYATRYNLGTYPVAYPLRLVRALGANILRVAG